MKGFKEYLFVDFKKASDSINRSGLFLVLHHYGIPKAVSSDIQELYNNSSSAVTVDGHDGGISEPFDVTTGVLYTRDGDQCTPKW